MPVVVWFGLLAFLAVVFIGALAMGLVWTAWVIGALLTLVAACIIRALLGGGTREGG